MTVAKSTAGKAPYNQENIVMSSVSTAPTIAAAIALTVWSGALTAHAEPLVYIPLGDENRIVVVDAASDKVVGAIDGVNAVHGLAGTPDGRFLIAGSYDERPVGGAAPAKPVGVSANEHAAHHAPPAPAAGKDAEAVVSTVSVIGAVDRTIVRAIEVPGAVHHVAVSPDGQYAIVTRPNEGEISAIDLTTYQIVANVVTGSLPNYSAFSQDGETLYVSNAGDDNISIVDVGDWSVKAKIAVGSSPEHVVLSRDGNTLYVNNVNDGTVSVVDAASARVTDTIPVGPVLHGIDLSDDGSSLYVASTGDESIGIIDLASGRLIKLTVSPTAYHLATIAGTGKIYVSSSDDPTIWVVDQEGFEVMGRIEIGGKGHQMVTIPSS